MCSGAGEATVNTTLITITAGLLGAVVSPNLRVFKGGVRPAKGLSTVNLC
jgi:hypothetical protein